MIVFPVFQNRSARYTFDIELANRVFHFIFSWNSREESWYMDIQDGEEVPIIHGIKLVPNYRLLKQYKAYNTLPDGELILWDLEQDSVNSGVTFDNFGSRYQLLFFTSAEIEAGKIL